MASKIPADAKIEIRATYKCPACGGTGVIQNPLWAEFFKLGTAEAERLLKPENDAEFMAWFRERGGVNVRSAPTWDGLPREEVCPEEDYCSECENSGEVSEFIPLDDALQLCPTIQSINGTIRDHGDQLLYGKGA